MQKRQSYSKEFKIGAIERVRGGRGIGEVARELGVHVNMLWKWKQQYEQDTEGSFVGKGHMGIQEEELRKLQREVAMLKQERDILKKAVSIFAQR